MTVPILEMIAALRDTLVADAGLSALVEDRVYDEIPTQDGKKIAEFPYVSFSTIDGRRADAECWTAQQYTVQIDVWSRSYGSGEAFQIIYACKRALHAAKLILPTHHLTNLFIESERSQRDPDGLTKHGILTVGAFVTEQP